MERGNFLFFSPLGDGGGSGSGPGGGSGDVIGSFVEYDHPNHGLIKLPVMRKMDGQIDINEAFTSGPVNFQLMEVVHPDGSVILAAYNVSDV